MSTRLRYAALALVTLAAIAAACGDDDPPTAVAQAGRIRFVNAVGNDAALTIRVDGALVTPPGGIAFGGKSSFVSTPIGTRAVAFYRATNGDSLGEHEFPVLLGQDYTHVVAGRSGGSPNPRPVTSLENAAPPAGQASLRLLHASPATAGSVDVYVTAPAADIAMATPAIGNLPFGVHVAPLTLAPGTYRVRVTTTGTKTVRIDDEIALAAGRYLALAVGDDAPGTGSSTAFEVRLIVENAN